ncbi:hypothetical protein GGF31_006649 [Allomyces arbusculus]|nr:hypothetical protein GGF31_006649 [Allomyces arbusculus]
MTSLTLGFDPSLMDAHFPRPPSTRNPGAPPTEYQRLAATLATAGGLISFSTCMVMTALGRSAVQFDHAHAVRWMVWFDAVAFVVFYSSSTAAESLDGCGRAAMWFAADLIWSFKDAARIDYMVSRALILAARGAHAANALPPRRSRLARQCARVQWAATTAVLSLILYWVFMAQVYNFSAPGCIGRPDTAQVAASSAWAVVLYSYWSICDLASGTLIVHTFWVTYHADAAAAAGATTTTAATAGSSMGLAKLAARHAVYRNIILREEGRVLLSLAGMLYITVSVTIAKWTQTPIMTPPVFPFCQLLLFLSTVPIADVEPVRQGTAASRAARGAAGRAAAAAVVRSDLTSTHIDAAAEWAGGRGAGAERGVMSDPALTPNRASLSLSPSRRVMATAVQLALKDRPGAVEGESSANTKDRASEPPPPGV